jgi:hypothetical protein
MAAAMLKMLGPRKLGLRPRIMPKYKRVNPKQEVCWIRVVFICFVKENIKQQEHAIRCV